MASHGSTGLPSDKAPQLAAVQSGKSRKLKLWLHTNAQQQQHLLSQSDNKEPKAPTHNN